VKAALGTGHATIGKTEIYPSGISVTYESEKADAKVEFVTVFPSFTPESTPAEMSPSRSKVAPRPTPSATQSLGVVDMHLHPGTVGRFPAKAFRDMVEAVPGFFQPHIPGLLAGLIAPFGPELGILNQSKAAGVQHSVLFAVYTQRSAGFFTNEELEDILTDPRNVAADGLPWAWGLASINFFDGYVNDRGVVNNSVAQSRLKALSSYFEKRRDLFIGIKLAHAHQGIAFDDQRYMGVYDVARKHRAPVYLHTGITPTAPTPNAPSTYDPLGLENTIVNLPDVTFILGHVGQGDPTSVEHSLALAAKYPNVFLEISALNLPFIKDDHGHNIEPNTKELQLPIVLNEIRARRLVGKTLYGSDGPQAPGFLGDYMKQVKTEMGKAGYTDTEQKAVLGDNFRRVFFPSKP
jgi:hypothetical protein